MNEPENGNRRAQFFIRFLLENVGGLLAVAAVVFAAGALSAKLDNAEKSIAYVAAQVNDVDTRTHNISLDVAVVKSKVETIEREQVRLRIDK